jgi:D-alanine-D-alanine ligase
VKVVVIYDIDLGWNSFEISSARSSALELCRALREEGIEAVPEELNNAALGKLLDRYDPDDTLLFNLCETLPGIPESESSVIRTIQERGFSYTGNMPDVIDLSYDKQQVKEVLASCNIKTPYGEILTVEEAEGWELFPAIVKPSREHCSLTISEDSVVYDTFSLKKQIAVVNEELKQPALVEDFIDGREFHVSVWCNGKPEMLPPAEMDFSFFGEARDRLCTYDSKFIPGSRHYEMIETLLPAPLDHAELRNMEDLVFQAWRGLGCRDYARFDLRLRDRQFYLLDFNPNNDISIDTSFAMAAEIHGYSYGALAKKIVSMAANRHPVLVCTAWQQDLLSR